MSDASLIPIGILIAITLYAAAEYYKHLKKAQKEYEKAKSAIDDIVLSFNRQFRSLNERLEVVGYRVEAADSKAEGFLNRAKDVERRAAAVESKVGSDLENNQRIATRLDGVEKKVCDALTSQEPLIAKITNLEEQVRQFSAIPETKIEAVIPIKREKALAQLTQTEVSVLELLASEGPKTAPEIKEKIGLSREHTARLMKKLYEEGYLERETNKIPFKYSVKKEMEKFLKKAVNEAV